MTWLRNLALVSALAVPTLLLPASARAAEASACGDFDFSVVDISECHFEFDGGCEANCTPLSFVAACDGGCNATVTSECTESCSSVCFESCSVDVNFSCAAECEVDCNARASADCSAEPNQAECEAYVVANCESNCDAGCQGTVDLSCEEQCAQCCSTSCDVDVNIGCELDCTAELSGGCEVDCQAPEGALFCSGQYINVQDLPGCVEYLIDNFQIQLDYEVSASGTINLGGKGCSMNATANESAFAAAGLMAAFAGLFAARRRRTRK